MNNFGSTCITAEAFYTVCGHVVTRIKHFDECPKSNHNPYFLDGQQLGYICRSYFFALAILKNSSCQFCLDKDHTLSNNEWRSDTTSLNGVTSLNHEAVSPTDIQDRREYWTRFIEQQRVFLERGKILERAAAEAMSNINIFTHEYPLEPAGPEYKALCWTWISSNRKRCWYLAQQNFHIKQIRLMIPDIERDYLFEEENVNAEILAPVLLADIPRDEICGICRQSLSEEEFSGPNGVRRTFCGHVYHHDCIVRWFKVGEGINATCPVCRSRRYLLRPPVHEWNNPDSRYI